MTKEQSQKLNTKPSSSKTDLFKDLPTPKKSTKDYGELTIQALKRQKD